MRNGRVGILIGMILAALLMEGCGSVGVKSAWLSHDLAISGDVKDMPGGVTEIAGTKIWMGVVNNRDFLYLAMAVRETGDEDASNPSLPITAVGLTAWFDPQGGGSKTLGIKFPLVKNETGLMPVTEEAPVAEGQPATQVPPEAVVTPVDTASNYFGVIDGYGNVQNVDIQTLRNYGFDSKTSYSDKTYFYEMRIPLFSKDRSPFPKELAAKGELGFGIDGEEYRQIPAKARGRRHGGRHGGFRLGLGGGGLGFGATVGAGSGSGNGQGNEPNNGTANEPDKFNTWLTIDLASEK
jgi:hypothetical protein